MDPLPAVIVAVPPLVNMGHVPMTLGRSGGMLPFGDGPLGDPVLEPADAVGVGDGDPVEVPGARPELGAPGDPVLVPSPLAWPLACAWSLPDPWLDPPLPP